MKTIQLHGWLGKTFGEFFTLDIMSPAEAVRALCAIVPGFKNSLAVDESGFKLFIEDDPIGEEHLHNPFSDREVFHLVPVIAGSKSGVGQLLLGVVLLAAAFVTMGTSLAGFEIMAGITVGQVLTTVGVSMVLGGIAQMMFQPPKSTGPKETATNTPSYSFNGVVNTLQQGNCVPVAYGELTVGSQVVSAGLFTEDFVV